MMNNKKQHIWGDNVVHNYESNISRGKLAGPCKTVARAVKSARRLEGDQIVLIKFSSGPGYGWGNSAQFKQKQ